MSDTRDAKLQNRIKAESQQTQFAFDLTALREQAALKLARLNVLLNRPSDGGPPSSRGRSCGVGKPYLEIDIDREAIARHGEHIGNVQQAMGVHHRRQAAHHHHRGAIALSSVRVRHPRELRDTIEGLEESLVPGIRAAVVEAGCRRVRRCLITTAGTILALLPILTSTGRAANIMIPVATPSFSGMRLALLTMFLVPVLILLATGDLPVLKSDGPGRTMTSQSRSILLSGANFQTFVQHRRWNKTE